MATTPIFGLRYPVGSDDADVPTWMHNLALDLEGYLGRMGEVSSTALSAGNAGKVPIAQSDGHLAYKAVSGDLNIDQAGVAVIPPGSLSGVELVDNSIGTRALDVNAVAQENMQDNSAGEEELTNALLQKVGVTDTEAVRRGKSVVPAAQSRTNTAYGLLGTPDKVSSVAIANDDDLLIVSFEALWQEQTTGNARAAIFLGTNQLKVPILGVAAPVTQAAGIDPALLPAGNPGAAATYRRLITTPGGLVTSTHDTAATSDVTTGQADGLFAIDANSQIHTELNGTRRTVADGAVVHSLMGGLCVVRGLTAAGGPYDVSVQFKASAGSVTAKERRLEVWTVGF